MLHRAFQALVKLALEPEWEVRFEPNSYGFRPGRCPHDAIEAVFNFIRLKPKYVFDADITKCFDNLALASRPLSRHRSRFKVPMTKGRILKSHVRGKLSPVVRERGSGSRGPGPP